MTNKKIVTIVSVITVVLLIIISMIIGINIYKNHLKKNVDIYISSVSLVENPDDPNNEEVYGLLSPYYNQTVGDICVYYDVLKEFSEAEKNMEFDLNKFNVYKIEIACDKKNIAEVKFVFVRITDFCRDSEYMNVPCNVSSNICVENTLYYFVSKEYSKEDVKQYLKNTGSLVDVCIGKDELHPIAKYDKEIFYKNENK